MENDLYNLQVKIAKALNLDANQFAMLNAFFNNNVIKVQVSNTIGNVMLDAYTSVDVEKFVEEKCVKMMIEKIIQDRLYTKEVTNDPMDFGRKYTFKLLLVKDVK